MRVTYTAPNRAHHFAYAEALNNVGLLHAFVSGVSRFSPRGRLEIGSKFVRTDHVQSMFLFSQRLRVPRCVCDELAYWAKIQLDWHSVNFARESDAFLFYSGAGLKTMRSLSQTNVACIVEAVNSHARYQEALLREEYELADLHFHGFHRREMARRIAEYEEADRILCPSDFVANSFVAEGIPRERIDVVPYGFSLAHGKRDLRVRRDGFNVLYVGQISIRKGLRYLVKAFAGFKYPKKKLTIVGPTASPSGLEGISIPPEVHFAGVLKGEDLRAAYRSADVFVLPTVEEGLALVLGEALSHGLPVIATVNSGAANLFTNGREGFIVPIRCHERIESSLQELAGNEALRHYMSVAALERAQLLGGWRENARMLVQVLENSTKLS